VKLILILLYLYSTHFMPSQPVKLRHHNSHHNLCSNFNLDASKERRGGGRGRCANDRKETEVEPAVEGGCSSSGRDRLGRVLTRLVTC
jgi:hypothetical protein